MGDQPNISQLLQALAAQRPAGTPGQPQIPQLGQQQNAYPGNYNSSSPPVPTAANYGLPPPDNTGSLNLAGVKPGDAGSVSIAEAIAKARGIAAEKGLAYDPGRGGPPRDSDPRGGARPHRRSRSPSPQRSPQRMARDNFRDNYNPYRDERRDDRRGNERSYARERSFSPRPAGRGGSGFSPQSRPSAERRSMGDDNVDSINIESNLVGLIIGRQGESLRKVEADTGARIQFLNSPESNGSVRLCKITGSRASRDDAKAEISRIISENRPGQTGQTGQPRPGSDGADRGFNGSKASTLPTPGEGESTMQIMVPDRTVGLIIGRGGETIRDLQERSGCHVNIVSESKSYNGLRPVNLMGTPEASQRAQDMIKEIVESDTRQAASQPQHQQPRGPPFGGGGGGDFSEKVNDSVFVPSEAVGMIIGKGGETIKEMQSVTRCKINVHQSAGGRDAEREVALFGSRDAVEQAKVSIQEKIEAVEQRSRPPGRPRDDSYSDRYSQPQQQQQQSYYPQQDHSQNYQQPAQQGGADAADPYAAYGGYQNYVAMWYAAMAQQQQQPGQQPQQGGQSSSDQPGPPGVS